MAKRRGRHVWMVWADHGNGDKGFSGKQYPDKGQARQFMARLKASHPGVYYELRRVAEAKGVTLMAGALGRGFTSKERRDRKRARNPRRESKAPKRPRKARSSAVSAVAKERARHRRANARHRAQAREAAKASRKAAARAARAHREALADAKARGMAQVYRKMGYRVTIRRGRSKR